MEPPVANIFPESDMKRREFCRSILATSVAAAIPGQQLIAGESQYSSELLSTVQAITASGKETTLGVAAVKELKDSLRGSLLLNGDDGYDHARAVWNAMINKRPALIARCEGPADVVNSINFARANSLRVSVRGGGHSISGKSVCEGGLMIDMSNMNSVRVNGRAATASADGGCLEGHIDREASLVGLATTGGIVSHTGAAGLTLGGGYGRLCRKFGLACDNLIGADIVTVDGTFRHVSNDENPELLWALKGGGGNFGVVTALEYQLHTQNPMVTAGDLVFDWADARNVLSFYAEYGNELPDELNMNVTLLTTSDGERRIAVEAVWSGNPKDADKALGTLRSVAKPLADTVKMIPYTSFQKRGDNSNRHGIRQYMKSGLVSDFSEALVDEVIEIYRPNPMANFFFMQAGGAVSRVKPTDTAFPHRSAHCNMMCWNKWFDPETSKQRAQRIADVKADWAILEPFTHGFYVNLNDDSEKKTHSNYGSNYGRLVEVKNKYDPTNLLKLNANIQPTIKS
jgi:FAD/FMN-containing dehydrogenase